MIFSIKRFFDENLKLAKDDSEENSVCKVRLASAALLFELLKTDSHIDDRETAAVREVIARTFELDEQALTEIIDLAEIESHQSVSLYEFTSLINSEYDYAQKVTLIENMWRVAFADHVLDKYEENMIRKTADLIYVSHSDFIKSKLTVRDQTAVNQKSS
jgi:uncharacterized tellurite resistance protein B-like protein